MRVASPARRPSFRPLVELLEQREVLSTYYVASNGSNGSNGLSDGAAWATLQYASDHAVAGDTVIVRAGTYRGWVQETSGTTNNYIKFLADPGVIVNQAGNLAVGTFTADRGDGINIELASWIHVEGFTVYGIGRGGGSNIDRACIRSVENDHIIIKNNMLDGGGHWGVLTGFTDFVTIEGNTCINSIDEHGIYVSNSCLNPIIRNNTIYGNRANGIHMNGDAETTPFAKVIAPANFGIIQNALVEGNTIYNNGVGGGSGINGDGLVNSLIQNNLLYNNHASGISLYRIDARLPATGNTIINNTIIMASDGRWAINIRDGSTGNTLFNNILYNNHSFRGSISVWADSLSGFRSDYNVVMNRFTTDDGTSVQTLTQWQAATGQDTHSIVAAPSQLFVDVAANNYHLKAGSPAINVGVATFNGKSAPTVDRDGIGRPSGSAYDIGAYEFVSSVTQAPTTTTVSSSAPTSQAGQSVTFTANVSSGTAGTITGTVTFRDGSTVLGTATLSGGQATFTTSSLSVASHAITAVYSGDTAYTTSTSATLTQTVNKAGSTTTLTSSASSTASGQAVTFTATVSSGTGIAVTGTVTFMDGSTTLGSATLSGGQASFSTTALAVGSHSITAVYGGNASVNGSTSAARTHTVTAVPAAATTTTISSSAATSQAGQAVTFTARVTSGTAGTIAGTVTFRDGSTTLATVTLSNGQATFTSSTLSVGSHAISAVYNGSSAYAASTSATLTQTVNKTTSASTLTSSATSTTVGQSVTFTATVTTGTGIVATGTVTFRDGSTMLGTATLSGGRATFATTGLALGSHSITAVYAGDAKVLGSTSTVRTHTVKAATSTSVVSSAPSATVGQAVTFTATVSSSAGTPTGSVVFKDGATTLATVALSGGRATFTTSALTAGTHAITAVYGGTATFAASTSAVMTQTITAASAQPIRINFTTTTGEGVAGYLADTGKVFGDRGNGYIYGWNLDNSTTARDRDSTASADERYDSLLHMQKPENPNAYWEIAVANGTYQVRVAAGDPGYFDSIFRINVENTLALNATPTSTQRWFEATVTVTVTDGRLTISNAAGAQNNKINYIDILRV